MKTSIATVSISGDFPEKLSAIANAGFDGIEIFEQDFIAYDGSPSEVGKRVRDHGLEIMLFQPFRDFEGLPEPDRSRAFERAKRKFAVMQELGTDLILVCSSVHPNSMGGIDRSAQDLCELGELARAHGVRIGYEALAWGRHVNDHRDAWEIVRRADHRSVGLIVDSFHTLGRKLSSETIRSIPGEKIFFVQLADAPLIEMDLLFWSRHFRNMPGEGDLDVVGFMRAVAATGYDGPLSLEIFNDQFRGGSPATIATDGYRSLYALMDQVIRVEPAPQLEVPRMPERVKIERVEFVEFAAGGEEAERLGELLKSLGFQKVGRHINKDVDLWQQGNIKIVINTHDEGFARDSFVSQGTTVCDIGLKVEDAEAAVARAEVLTLNRFQQTIGRGELALPAIHSVGNGIMHFIDDKSGHSRVWEAEFAAKDLNIEGAGLTRIDHIAQSMDYQDMLTWSLFYTSMFNMEKKPIVDVIDPAGIVRSQVIETTDESLRITMNGAESNRTLAGGFVAKRSGSAIQHIAFETEDIFRTAKLLRKFSFETVAMPENYYADVQARFGLSETECRELKENNLLYDEEGSGKFFQLYSKPFGEGFFFEIVQRLRGYNGYGAANAPYRTAALKRIIKRAA